MLPTNKFFMVLLLMCEHFFGAEAALVLPGRPSVGQQKRLRVECELAAPLNESKGFYKSNKRT
jgi:hypothetical protein